MTRLFDRSTVEFLKVAEGIGHRISAQAIWHEDRCNWLGADPVEQWAANVVSGLTYRTLGADLYSGTSGVALFLAELFAINQDPEIHRAAIGAIRQALSRVDTVPPAARLGLFSGWIGIALAAVRVAMILDEPAILARALFLLQQTRSAQSDEFDVVSGKAGAIAALIVLAHVLDDFSLLEFAACLGDELLEAANRADIGYSWKSRSFLNHHNLTGFSHGAAGAAYALLELYNATGVSKYRDAASFGFQYERHWFSPKTENWPDFRKDLYSPARKKRPYACLSYWCHGAPGIALSRLRAYEILNDETCKAEALSALRTTRASIEAALNAGTGNFSMCHGLPGNAEALIYGAWRLGLAPAEEAVIALDVADAGIERYVETGAAWPCGTHVGETPNLMLGLAGIGHYYLRLNQPSIPSILILRKEDWRGKDGGLCDPAEPLRATEGGLAKAAILGEPIDRRLSIH